MRNTYVMIQESITPKLKGLHLFSLGLGIATTGAVFVTLPMTQVASEKELPPMSLEAETSSSAVELRLAKAPEVIEFIFGPETIIDEQIEAPELVSNIPTIELAPVAIELEPGIGSLHIDTALPAHLIAPSTKL
ncbi:MAG: hypothetical protein ACPGJU_02435 [Coraliomargarita sp.]